MAKQRVPKKNIEPVIVDVKKPSFNYERLKKFETVNLTKVPEKKPKRWGRTKRALFFAAISIIVFFIGATLIVAANLEHVKASVATSGQNVVQNFIASADAIKKMEPQAAAGYLAENSTALSNINTVVKQGFTGTLLGTLSNFVPLFKNAFDFLGQATQLNLDFYTLAQDLTDIQTQAVPDLMHDGPALLAMLYKTHTLLQEIAQGTENIKNATAALQNLSPYLKSLNASIGNDYLKYNSQIYSWDNVLVTLTNWLASPSPRHLLVFFENPAEIRPGGGFLGSYADLTIQGGQLTNIDVRDIYDPDGQLKEKVVPPEELQGITRNWGASKHRP